MSLRLGKRIATRFRNPNSQLCISLEVVLVDHIVQHIFGDVDR
ncbi:hypothetical protein Pr1d_15910 [Bythopirellula goksoeyrii]|uniref:Uncharacterized protein n=1 Tax=Bythopirellula goksoeyrii TaxID=1400387 RepID=A0A5B9Q5R0_9BACT|nr:hypothetical protein Pr1d_15910 [Bythopirellula goksoeyrii]